MSTLLLVAKTPPPSDAVASALASAAEKIESFGAQSVSPAADTRDVNLAVDRLKYSVSKILDDSFMLTADQYGDA